MEQLIYDIVFGTLGRIYLFIVFRSPKERENRLRDVYDNDYVNVGSTLLAKSAALVLFIVSFLGLVAALIYGLKSLL